MGIAKTSVREPSFPNSLPSVLIIYFRPSHLVAPRPVGLVAGHKPAPSRRGAAAVPSPSATATVPSTCSTSAVPSATAAAIPALLAAVAAALQWGEGSRRRVGESEGEMQPA